MHIFFSFISYIYIFSPFFIYIILDKSVFVISYLCILQENIKILISSLRDICRIIENIDFFQKSDFVLLTLLKHFSRSVPI